MKSSPSGLLLAAALGFSALAHADESSVQIYGLLIPFFDNGKTSGATAAGTVSGASLVPSTVYTGANASSRSRLTSGTSTIGFRGTEDLGGGLKAIFQIENAVPLDGDPGPNTFASRNSNVGLASNWGTLFFGNWDTPYKWT
jgi:predicted porin